MSFLLMQTALSPFSARFVLIASASLVPKLTTCSSREEALDVHGWLVVVVVVLRV
jgi:hypothetical protein